MNRKTLKDSGFAGFRPLGDLDINRIPQRQGLFAIVRPSGFEPRFLAKSTAGVFKKKNPSLTEAELAGEWVTDADILFLGKADPGSKGTAGCGARSRNWWTSVKESRRDTGTAASSGSSRFRASYGRLPYANLVPARA